MNKERLNTYEKIPNDKIYGLVMMLIMIESSK